MCGERTVNLNRSKAPGRQKTVESWRARLYLTELLFFSLFLYIPHSLLTPDCCLKVQWVTLLVNLGISGNFLSFYTAYTLNIPLTLPQATAQVLDALNISPFLIAAGGGVTGWRQGVSHDSSSASGTKGGSSLS